MNNSDKPSNADEEQQAVMFWLNIVISFNKWGTPIFTNLCTFIDLLCFIMLISKFIYKIEPFCSAYYYLLTIGYFSNIILTLSYDIRIYYSNKEEIPSLLFDLIAWYTVLFVGPWNTVLAFSRFTALFLWNHHNMIWSGWRFKLIIILLIGYPFLLSLNDIDLMKCFFHLTEICNDSMTNSTISNFINSFLALIFGLSTALARKFNIIKNQNPQPYEKQLLTQSIFSSIIFCISQTSMYVAVNYIYFAALNNYTLMIVSTLLDIIMYGTFSMFYASSTVMLFCLSKVVRKNFIKFYRLRWILHSKIQIIVVVPPSSTTANTNSQQTLATNKRKRNKEIIN